MKQLSVAVAQKSVTYQLLAQNLICVLVEKGDAVTKDGIANSKETDKEKALEENELKPVAAAAEDEEVTKKLDKMTVKDDVDKEVKKESTASHEVKNELN